MKRRIEVARCAALVAVVFACWATVYDKWSWAAWQRPIGYDYDALYNLGIVKAAADLDWVPFLSKQIHRLGAPFVADWNDYPVSEDHLFFFTGLVARVFGPVLALNFAFLIDTLLAALTMYLVGRWLRLRWEACFVAGVLFALAPFTFYRSVHHFGLNSYWHLPLLVPLGLWISEARPLLIRSRRFVKAAGIAVLLGIYFPYYLNYGLQIVVLGALVHAFRRKWRRVLPAALLAGIAMSAFVVTNLDSIVNTARRGRNPAAVSRAAVDVEVYALRPLELFHPGQRHHLAAFGDAAARHAGSAIAVGEFPSPYLGIVGGVAFAWLLVATLRALLLGKRAGWGRLGAWSVWLVFLAIDGGGMQLIQIATNLRLFRSNNRVSIVLLAFALLFFARLLSALPRRKLIAPLAVLLLALGVYDQTPSPRVDPNSPHHQSVAVREQIAAADQRLVEKVEARLAPGALVYEFPAQDYPEAGWTARMSDYDPMRPYLWSKTLRFSYGNMKGRPEAAWQRQVAQMNDADRLTELQNKGFSAIYVLREGFEDSGQVDALLQALKERGHTEVIESDFGDSFFVVLRPVFP